MWPGGCNVAAQCGEIYNVAEMTYCRFRLGPEFGSGRGIEKIEKRNYLCVHLKFYAVLDMSLMTR